MIREMRITNIGLDPDGDGEIAYGTKTVDKYDLNDYWAKNLPVLDEREFFFLACEYLEETDDEVVDTDTAKIDIWYD